MKPLFLVGLIVTLGSCSDGGSAVVRSTTRSLDSRLPLVVDAAALQWRFEPTAADAESILAMLGRVTQGGEGPLIGQRTLPASIQVFDRDSSGQRYLLTAYQSLTTTVRGDTIWGHSYYIIGRHAGTFVLSSPWALRDAEGSTVEVVGDVDGDGSTDLVYCERYEGGDPSTVVHAITPWHDGWRLLAWKPNNPARYCDF